PERVLPDQKGRHALDALFFSPVKLVAGDAVDARVGIDAQVRDADPRLLRPRRPRRVEGLRQGDVDLTGPDLRDAHPAPTRAGPGGEAGGAPGPRPSSDTVRPHASIWTRRPLRAASRMASQTTAQRYPSSKVAPSGATERVVAIAVKRWWSSWTRDASQPIPW